MTRSCPSCGDLLEAEPRVGTEEQRGPVRAVVESRRMPSCPRACSLGLSEAIERALEARLVSATRTRWSRSGDRCGACSAGLDLPLRATTRSVTVEPPGAAPFTVTLSLPLGRCPDCGCDNVPSALIDAVRSAALLASGAALRPRRRRGAQGSRGPA